MGGVIGRIIGGSWRWQTGVKSRESGRSARNLIGRPRCVEATLEDYRWLVSGAAERWLAVAREEVSVGRRVHVGFVCRLRQELSASRTHLVIDQIELREQAREKFTRADQMFFTRKGLEQATDEQLASYKAARFPRGGICTDLCCGIGGDLLALALRGPAQGIDRDPVTAVIAAANAAAHGFDSKMCRIQIGDAVEGCPLTGPWHCDPDRRTEGKRTTRGELFEPSLEAADSLLCRNCFAAIKLAPATHAPADWTAQAELEWSGSRRECL